MITETGEDTAPETTKYPAVQYDITEAGVAELRKKYEGLTIQGPTDKGGLTLVRTGRLECKGIRVAIEKRRVQYNSGALDFTRTVNAKAKEATAPVRLLEESLKAEEDRIKKEIAEIKAAKQKEEEDRLQRRLDLLLRFGKQLSIVNLKAMSDDEFQVAYDEAKAEHEAEQARIAKEAEEKAAQEEIERKEMEAKEEADRLEREALEETERVAREAKEEEDRKEREAEEARLAEERADLDKVSKKQEAKEEELRLEKERLDKEQAENEAEIKAENDRLEAERVALDIDKKFEAAKKEAAAQATKEAEEKAKREAEEKEEADRKALEEAAWRETLRPDMEKLDAYGNALRGLPLPKVESEEAKALLKQANLMLQDVIGLLVIQPNES